MPPSGAVLGFVCQNKFAARFFGTRPHHQKGVCVLNKIDMVSWCHTQVGPGDSMGALVTTRWLTGPPRPHDSAVLWFLRIIRWEH